MQISTNYSTPSFKANIIPVVEQELILKARKADCLMEFMEQVKNVKSWGSPKSFIAKSKGQMRDELVLENFHLSNFKTSKLNVKKNKDILSQFLNLKEDDIINAQRNLLNEVKILKQKKKIYYA